MPDYERRSLNHPVIVWRKWTTATRVKKPKPRIAGVSAARAALDAFGTPGLLDLKAALQEEPDAAKLRKKVVEQRVQRAKLRQLPRTDPPAQRSSPVAR